MYKFFLKPFFFMFSPEKAHNLAMKFFKVALSIPLVNLLFKKHYRFEDKLLETEVFGIKFPNPLGMAAGFDKNAKYMKELYHLGFGFVEVGTVTPVAQEGNPKPRLFRLKKDEALINRMGFNNDGVGTMVQRLKNRYPNLIIGGNIGKNKITPNESALDDYIICFEKLFPYVDYFVVNVSSPNTPNLRELQEKEPLKKLLSAVQQKNAEKINPKPVLLKIAPDLTNEQLDDIIEIINETKLAGLIATNTTINRSGLVTDKKAVDEIGAGGLSGKPVRKRSTEVIRYIHEKSNGSIKIIGVGGIHTGEDAIEKLEAGACLVQVYSGFIYEGPKMAKNINKKILEYIRKKNNK